MYDTTREASKDSLKQWRNYIILVVFSLSFPYRWSVSSSSLSLILDSLFYSAVIGQDVYFQLRVFYFLSLLNLILLIIPSAYFTYRRISKYEHESIESLGLVITALTFIVLGIISYRSYLSNYQIDDSATPTPNLQYLPGFSLLVIFLTVFMPILVNQLPELLDRSVQFSKGEKGGIRSRLSISPGPLFGILLFILPSGFWITLQGSFAVGFTGTLSLELLGSFYSGTIDILQYGLDVVYSGSFILGGIISIYNIVVSLLWNFLLLVFALLYLREKIQPRLFILGGLVSIIPHLFLMFASFFRLLSISLLSSFYIPLPLLQIAVMIILRREATMSELTKGSKTLRRKSEIVKVPITYILTSSIRRMIRGFRRKNDEQHLTTIDTLSKEELSHDGS